MQSNVNPESSEMLSMHNATMFCKVAAVAHAPVLSPHGRPAVADEPVGLAVLVFAVADELNEVVEVWIRLVTAVEDPLLVVVPVATARL
jgi:hypothetical protein